MKFTKTLGLVITGKKDSVNIPAIKAQPVMNEAGEILPQVFLRDRNFTPDPSITGGRTPQNMRWNSQDSSLPIHFHTDLCLFENVGKPVKKFGMLIEPQEIDGSRHRIINLRPSLVSDYDVFFTHNERLLDKLPNAKPFIMGGLYVGTSKGGGEINPLQYEKKTKNISLVSSHKTMCKLHKFRMELAKHYVQGNEVDCYGTFNGKLIQIADSLMEYRYSIIIENAIEPYWFTEKICNCFATMTVPIYLGSPDIGKYFNMDGIITIDKWDVSFVDKLIKQCSVQDYEQRMEAIKDNCERVKAYTCTEDWLFSQYGDLFKI